MMTLPDFGEDIGALLFSPDGRSLAVGCFSGMDGRKPVQLWRAPTLAEIDGQFEAKCLPNLSRVERVNRPK
jgi:hypothetical protein